MEARKGKESLTHSTRSKRFICFSSSQKRVFLNDQGEGSLKLFFLSTLRLIGFRDLLKNISRVTQSQNLRRLERLWGDYSRLKDVELE